MKTILMLLILLPVIAQASTQKLVVTLANKSTIHGKLQFWQYGHNRWRKVGDEIPVVIGKNGSAYNKKEGDNKTPLGTFPLDFVFGFSKPKTSMPFLKLQPDTTCVDDVQSANYTKIVNNKTAKGEKMYTYKHVYRFGMLINYNQNPVVKGKGSCVFMHIWRGANIGTAGCVAMKPKNLLWILRKLKPKQHPVMQIRLNSVH
ncbi:MAG: L,D-transpeptidase family protein [Gammaproteobacteria bacterium]|nr:L,D-transpeptidase family protein [Gammaproteobacteria bacterium]